MLILCKTNKKWTRRDSNPRPPPCENENIIQIEGYIINWYDVDEKDFINYLTIEKKPKITSKEYLNEIIKILDKYLDKPIKSKEDLRKAFYKCTDKERFVRAVRNLIHYLVEREMMNRWIAMDILSSSFLKIPKSGVREVYLTNEEIKQGYYLIKEKWDEDTLILYQWLVFTGLRAKPSILALRNFDKNKIEYHGNVAAYPMVEFSRGTKRSFIAVFPSEFAEKLRSINKKLKYKSWYARLNPRKWRPPVNSRIDANAIRKWVDNFFVLHNIPESVADFMQGRASVKVGSKHYLFLRMQAIEHYKKVVDKFPILVS